jgi:hypothetical protein
MSHVNLCRAAIICLAIFLSGCSTTAGPKPILSAAGTLDPNAASGVAKTFANASAASFASPSTADLAHAMANSGFTLIYANCSDFFLSAGETQKWLIVSRDTVGAVGTLATGLLALHGGSSNAVSNLAFVTGASFAGLDIYTKNFLFAAENIEAVRSLITRALSVHRDAVITSIDSYESATLALLDNQNICSPMQISALVKEAIKKGEVVPIAESPGGLTSFTVKQDENAMQTLGSLLSPPTLDIDKSGALWWLLKVGRKKDAEELKAIAALLKDIPPEKSPFNLNGEYLANWSLQSSVNKALDLFSSTTKIKFNQKIEQARAAEEAKSKLRDIQHQQENEDAKAAAEKKKIPFVSNLPAPPPPMAPPKFELGAQPSATSKHISIGIR